jgi:signal transduction histidine kinase
VKADYSWVALHDSQDSIATIVSEYIDRVDRIVPTSKIGNQIDISLYPEFYNHLFDNESWIDPPEAIIPKPYLNLLTPTAQLLICPIMVDPLDRDWVSGEVGILTTGKSPWTASQALLITQTLNYAVKIFRQTHRQVLDRKSLALSLAWLNSLQADFRSSIADVNRDLHIAAQMLKQEIDSIDRKTENLAAIEDRQSLHRELSVNLQIVQTQWHRKFQLIDALIDIRANGTTFQIQSLSDIQFDRWIADVVGRCSDLAAHYRQEIGYQMVSESITPILLCPFPILELIILELVHNVCKYTPPDRLIILEIDIRDHQLQLSVIGVGTEKSARKLEKIFLSFANNSLDLSWQSDITSLGLTLVNKLVPLIDSELGFNRDRGEIRLILNVPLQ